MLPEVTLLMTGVELVDCILEFKLCVVQLKFVRPDECVCFNYVSLITLTGMVVLSVYLVIEEARRTEFGEAFFANCHDY